MRVSVVAGLSKELEPSCESREDLVSFRGKEVAGDDPGRASR
jgi:hypothetical protein